MDWEIRESLRLNKRVIGSYSAGTAPPLPAAFVEHGLKTIPWTHADLMRELDG